MENLHLLIAIVTFTILCLASRQIGELFARWNLPRITGYLFTGIIVGPFVLHQFTHETVADLWYIGEISLAFIAFAAGTELYLPDLEGRFRSIGWVTSGLVITTMILATTAVYLLSPFIPFMQGMPPATRIAIAIMAASILVARSPSSAIAIVNELRAKGPYTQTTLGVTVIMDVVVIFLFALSSSVADALLTNVNLNIQFLFLLLAEIVLMLGIGWVLYVLLNLILKWVNTPNIKTVLILGVGFGVFILADTIRNVSHELLPFEILTEPLLICLIASFLINNRSSYRTDFIKIIHDVGPVVYVAFFTLTGASLELDILAAIWPIALVLFFVRLISIMIGSFAGGVIAGDPMKHNRVKWMGFVTQAGVALGLASEAGLEFPTMGAPFATMLIAVVVINEMIGPLFFKYALQYVGEARPKAVAGAFDGIRDAIIFGVDGQSMALAHQLQAHDWQVRLACLDNTHLNLSSDPGVDLHSLPDFSAESLRNLGADQADAVVLMLGDNDNYTLTETIYENFGIDTVVVRLKDRTRFDEFHRLGALVVDPGTVMVSTLDQFVRSPSATTLLLGMNARQDVADLEVLNPQLNGRALRDLSLPLDTLVLSVNRNGDSFVPHGYTKIQLGDHISLVGSRESIAQLSLRFEDQTTASAEIHAG